MMMAKTRLLSKFILAMMLRLPSFTQTSARFVRRHGHESERSEKFVRDGRTAGGKDISKNDQVESGDDGQMKSDDRGALRGYGAVAIQRGKIGSRGKVRRTGADAVGDL